jgi:uncharacterized linocin/CFP29 family protein
MTVNLSGRSDAPFSEAVWQKIDEIVTGAARGQLSARRLLYVEGPYGLGFKSLPGSDRVVKDEAEQGGASIVASPVQTIPEIQTSFVLGARDIAAFEELGLPFDTGAIAQAAIAAARKEDDILLNGISNWGLKAWSRAKVFRR